jgi:hypothetical protein
MNPNSGDELAVSPRLPPPVIADLPPISASPSSSFRQFVAVLLTLCLGLLLAAGAVSVLDDTWALLFGPHLLAAASAILGFISILVLLLVYGLMGLTPIVPKRVVLPLMLFVVIAMLSVFPTVIYCYRRLLLLDWVLSFIQVALVLVICHRLRGGREFRWSIVEVGHLGSRSFSWLNLSVFVLLNLFVALPGSMAYLALCASLAVGHFTDGFLALRPGGLILQARTYVREDGKRILLFPMSHIAEADFYKAVSQSASSNSIVLLEGVTDTRNLLTNELSYRRAAKSLGLAEQHDDLNIRRGRLIQADVDVQEFSSNTITLLNLVTLVHSKGVNAGTILPLTRYSPPGDIQNQLFTDLLLKRNEHLLSELRARLPESDSFVIPWGAAHMPGIAKGIESAGFHLVETHDYVSIRFGRKGNKSSSPGKVQDSGNSK